MMRRELGRARLAAAAFALVLGGFLGGRWCSDPGPEAPGPAGTPALEHAGHGAVEVAPAVWTCAMHPHIRLPGPGPCPICRMDRVPVETGPGAGGPDLSGHPRLELSPEAAALASIETAPVERRRVTRRIRLVGKVDFDETRVRTIASWMPGRIDRTFVDYTGLAVEPGAHLVEIYSPELRTAQEELVQSLRALRSLEEAGVETLRDASARTVDAAREKLRLLGLTPEQIDALEARGRPDDHVTIYAPIGGTVVGRHAVEGTYVETGTPLYEIADLSRVWVRLDAYESDMTWIRLGQEGHVHGRRPAG